MLSRAWLMTRQTRDCEPSERRFACRCMHGPGPELAIPFGQLDAVSVVLALYPRRVLTKISHGRRLGAVGPSQV